MPHPHARTLLLGLLLACDAQDHQDSDSDVPDTDEVTTLSTRAPFMRPSDPLAGSDRTSCALFEATRCTDGTLERCSAYDPGTQRFLTEIDPLRRRAWLYDRWFDLYHSPDGQTVSRDMVQGFGPGTPEEVWADPEAFERWDGFGDSAIWTGVATHAAMQRWLVTGTDADRARFETSVRAMLTQFEVTDAVGMLARAHFLIVPDGTPRSPDHLLLTESEADDPIRFTARDPSRAPDLPPGYGDPVPDGRGGAVRGRVGWQGNPSIDQYTGAMVTLPAAWSLLDNQGLKNRIQLQLVGYLHRLQRVEVRNLQANPDLAAAAAAALGGVELGEGLDLADLDTIVIFALPAYDHANEETYPRFPPEDLPLEPVLVLDASDASFLPDLFALASRLTQRNANSWDHAYAPSVRGGDAVHLMHLALMAWHMTGDDRYRAFLEDDLIANLRTDVIANTLGALVLPPWCRSFYGDHITLPPLWALLNLLGDSPLRDELVRAMLEEGGARLAGGLGNAKFDLMIADAMDADDPARAALEAEARDLLAALGGNGGILDEPRRTYTIDVPDLEDVLGSPLPLRCPTEAERSLCEDGFTVLGLTLPGESISQPCVGHPLQCPLDNGQCALGIAPEPLPVGLRRWQDFLWQRNPFEMGALYDPEGARSSPGLDLTESYWLARQRGVIDDPDVVLAWETVGTCE